jgi:urea carboxylase
MEGPGGYQFVGRTTQVWSRWRPFEDGSPALLRHFDRISWHPVSAEELLDLRADVAAGRGRHEISDGTFSLAAYDEFLASNAEGIAAFRAQQAEAFGAERAAWAAAGEFDPRPEPVAAALGSGPAVPDGGAVVEAPYASSVWRIDVVPGERVMKGQTLLAIEAMKMEAFVQSPMDGIVAEIVVTAGDQVRGGAPLVVVAP